MQSKRLKIFVLLASLAIMILLGGVLLGLDAASFEGREVAHHMAPNTNSVDIGNLNIDTVHNGINLGVMPVAPEIGAGNLNRQLWENPPPMP